MFTPAIEKRRIQWFNELVGLVNDLRARDPSLTVASLSADDEWIDAVLGATRIALRTHREEQWRALKSALAPIALRDEPDRDLDSMFLNLIDVLTPSHLRVLHMLQSTRAFAAGQGTTVPVTIDRSFSRVVEHLLPEVPFDVYTLLRADFERPGPRHRRACCRRGIQGSGRPTADHAARRQVPRLHWQERRRQHRRLNGPHVTTASTR